VHLSGDPNAGIFPQTILRIGDGVFQTNDGKIAFPSCLGMVVTYKF